MSFNLFTDGEYTYSPTKYVEKGKCRGDNSQTQSLIKLLKDFKAIDRYWKNEGPQPPDYEEAPPHIKKAEEERQEAERRKKREEEEQRRRIEKEQRELAEVRRKLALEQEAAQAKAAREERTFQQRQAHEAKMHAMHIAKENDSLKLIEAKDAHALKQAASMSKLRNDENEAEHRRKSKLLGEKKSLMQSQDALYWAYAQGLEQGGAGPVGPGGRKALGMSGYKANLDLGKRLQIEGRRIEEIDE
jgi:membrane protein involved in colicin uptake